MNDMTAISIALSISYVLTGIAWKYSYEFVLQRKISWFKALWWPKNMVTEFDAE